MMPSYKSAARQWVGDAPMTIVPTCLGAIAVGRQCDRGLEVARSPFTTDPSATLPECEEIVATEKFAAPRSMSEVNTQVNGA